MGWAVPGIAPPGTHPARATPGTPLRATAHFMLPLVPVRGSKSSRGALIRRSTHLATTLVAV